MNNNLKNYKSFLQEKKYKPNTLQSYLLDLLDFEEFLHNNEPKKELEEVTDIDVYEYRMVLEQEYHYKQTSINRRLCSIRSFYSYLFEVTGQQLLNFQSMQSSKNKYEINITSKENINSLINGIKEDNYQSFRNKLIIKICWETGLKTTEIINLRWENISSDNKTIYVSNDLRTIPITDTLNNKLIEYKMYQEKILGVGNLVFRTRAGEQFTSRGIQRLLKEECTKQKIDKSITFSTIRNTLAVELFKLGFNIKYVQNKLGYKNINELSQLYDIFHPENEDIDDKFRKTIENITKTEPDNGSAFFVNF